MAKHRRSVCPVACFLDLVGDKWTLLVVRDLARGCQHFQDFLASPEGIATNILTERLRRLVAAGLVEKKSSPGRPRRSAYRLTEKGKSLLPVLQSIAGWGLEHLEGTEDRLRPPSDPASE